MKAVQIPRGGCDAVRTYVPVPFVRLQTSSCTVARCILAKSRRGELWEYIVQLGRRDGVANLMTITNRRRSTMSEKTFLICNDSCIDLCVEIIQKIRKIRKRISLDKTIIVIISAHIINTFFNFSNNNYII